MLPHPYTEKSNLSFSIYRPAIFNYFGFTKPNEPGQQTFRIRGWFVDKIKQWDYALYKRPKQINQRINNPLTSIKVNNNTIDISSIENFANGKEHPNWNMDNLLTSI